MQATRYRVVFTWKIHGGSSPPFLIVAERSVPHSLLFHSTLMRHFGKLAEGPKAAAC